MSATTEIHTRVARVLVETLNADKEDVTPAATLQGDLGAESIDFLDIVFRLEREFNIRIPSDELFPDSILQGNPAFVQDGRVTDQGLAELRSRLPHADFSGFEGDRRLSAIPDLFGRPGKRLRRVEARSGQASGPGRPRLHPEHRQFLARNPEVVIGCFLPE